MIVTWFATKKCNYKCGNPIYGCAAGCQRHGNDLASEPELQASLAWLDKFAPGCELHITGGEPFMRDDIRECIEAFITGGYDVSIHTNGSLISDNLWAVELPIKWLVTHHPFSVSIEDFLEQIEPIKNTQHIVTRIFDPRTEPDAEIAALYADFNFMWRESGGGFHGLEKAKHQKIKCGDLVMIGQRGEVTPCSLAHIEIGSIYDLSYRPFEYKSPCRKYDAARCGTSQTAYVMQKLGGKK